ncbi:SDR family oxidoreductase [Saccharopolyspora mangrovi]|uniref:SDR family oxidoreductase n=1 Tax=Saccharopolyspora mangrovi TaxID=3082379 RepID=A0ABU6AE32_9PSEU|nr:SDR family oxidoreductase [Saccharopolyspora sp. S2-29]MEB3369790.1 SDR family oxidoreductase [Saccharopolyspora sp. S2-29]
MRNAARAQVVVITGATGGVGRAVAREYARRARGVALLARGSTGLEAAAAEVRAAGCDALPLEVDVADEEQVGRAADEVEARLGPIDVWVNAAFTSVFAPFSQIAPGEFRRVVEVDLLGFVHGTKAALDRMRPRDLGTIVQVGSALAYRGVPLQSAYCASKHAVQGFHESLRCELLHDRSGVRVTMVQLPAVNTPQFSWVLSRLPKHPQPLPPIFQPEVAARAVVHAADHPRRREYWCGGSTVGTLIANTFAPGLVDRYLARNGFAAQQSDVLADPDRPANLWAPADGASGRDYGARGVFDERSRNRSMQLWASHRHGALAAAVVGAAALTAAAMSRRRRL